MTEKSTAQQAKPVKNLIYFSGGTGHDKVRNDNIGSQIERRLGRATIGALADPLEFDPNFTMTIEGAEQSVTRKQAYGLAHTAEVSSSISHFQANRAQELLAHLGREGADKVDAIFQSADALSGLIAANANPEQFDRIILAYPAGLVQPHDIKKTGLRVVAQEAMARLKRRRRDRKTNYDTFTDPRNRKAKGTATIINSVGHSKQNKLLHELREKENSPGVGIVVGVDDVMIAPELVIQSLKPSDVDVILVVDSAHGINSRLDVLADTVNLFDEIDMMRVAQEPNTPLTAKIRFAAGVSEDRKQRILAAARARDELVV